VLSTRLCEKQKLVKKFIEQENWIDLNYFKTIERKFEGRKLIACGRLEAQKNYMLLLKAVDKLKLSLTLIGSGSEKHELEKYVINNHLDVKLKGRISYEGVANEFSNHDIFVSTTLFEGNPKTIIEALASGLVCIVPDIESVRKIIVNEKNGFLHDNSSDGVTKIIAKVLSLSNDELMKISKTAKKSVVDRYNLKNIAEKELRIYRGGK
jgi:glycosyltransferase involved in cell wall biosynthesis